MCISSLNFLFQGTEHPGWQRLHQAVVGGGLATGGGVGGASPDIMDPRPENLNPGISASLVGNANSQAALWISRGDWQSQAGPRAK